MFAIEEPIFVENPQATTKHLKVKDLAFGRMEGDGPTITVAFFMAQCLHQPGIEPGSVPWQGEIDKEKEKEGDGPTITVAFPHGSSFAPAGNRTRVCTVAGYYSTTRPLVLHANKLRINESNMKLGPQRLVIMFFLGLV
ncbi:hypothetical protein VNO77_07006 [Canavalia gladiata]|uniref:Uncharacterized protein n=1 Tax=Canavalia gladiata TaxID=3824 RepID=A0AAN9M778_CANGL